MAESKKTIRLMKAAKEFNIGKDTLVQFLSEKGFEVKNNPNTELSDDMYDTLMREYASEKAEKRKSEEIDLHKSEEKKPEPKKVIEKVSLRKDETVKVVAKGKIDLEPKPKKVVKKEEIVVEEKVVEEVKPIEVPTEKEVKKEKEEKVIEKISLKKEDGVKLKAKGKIDLNAKPTPPPIEIKKEEIIPEIEAVQTIENKQVVPEHVSRKKEILTGPKVISKIEIKEEPSKTKKPIEKARKKKRIPIGGAPQQAATDKPKVPYAPQGERRRNINAPRDLDDKVVDEAQIKERLNATLNKMAGNTNRKGTKAKRRKDKREIFAEKRAMQDMEDSEKKLSITEFISVSELASLMNIGIADIMGKCLELGIMVTINQRLDAEVIELVAGEFDFEVDFIDLEEESQADLIIQDNEEDLVHRAPIVTIMGHVDHGKTSLLDYIRNATVVAGEAGGITQHIGAYEVTVGENKKITFLDTPGHEAFTAMRARGAKVTDIAVIVVAADDAVMPQTKEAISHAQAAGVPMIFAINKMDKEGANPEKIREQLSQMNILVEDWGGKFQSQEISAKKGLNVDVLLEKILLEAELLDLKANPNREAYGTVVEAQLDKGRGYVTTILVQNGSLKVGDMLVAGQFFGRVKAMTDERGRKVVSAGPSAPVQILGLNGAPQSGEKFRMYNDEVEAKNIALHRQQIMREQGIRTKKHITLDEIGRRLALGNFKELNLIIKGDVDGSVEALSDALQKLSTDEIHVTVVHKAVGQITESDVLLATASDAIIVGFQVRPSSQASKIAADENIEIRTYSIIYDAIDEIKSAMEGMLEPKMEKRAICNIEIKEIFKITGVGTIAGCMVLDGKMKREAKINLIRDGIVVYNGELASLKRFKDDVKEVAAGTECGLNIKNYNDIKEGDIIEGYEEIEVKRKL